MKSNKIKLFFIIITNLVSAENLDLSQPWESNDSYIFLSQLDSVIVENIETLPNIAEYFHLKMEKSFLKTTITIVMLMKYFQYGQ